MTKADYTYIAGLLENIENSLWEKVKIDNHLKGEQLPIIVCNERNLTDKKDEKWETRNIPLYVAIFDLPKPLFPDWWIYIQYLFGCTRRWVFLYRLVERCWAFDPWSFSCIIDKRICRLEVTWRVIKAGKYYENLIDNQMRETES